MTAEEMNGKPLEEAGLTVSQETAEVLTRSHRGEYNTATIARVIEAFNNSYNVSEVCQYAGISRDTFYRWVKDHPMFAEKVEEAKAMPARKAKEVITAAIVAGDINTAKWYVERRDPDFKPKAEVDNNIGIKETRDKIKDFLDDDSTDDVSEQPAAADSPDPRGEVAQAPTDIS
jgi:DNA-binding phage protein